MLGKLTVPANLTDMMGDQGLGILDVTGQHTEGLRECPELVRHDPFDRLITSQAFCERILLLTADHVLLGLRRDFITDSTQ